MDHILFEQLRDIVKEVGVAEMINDKLIELHTVENKKKMSTALDEIKTRPKLIYQYFSSTSFSSEGVNGESFSWYKEGVSFSWLNSGCNIELRPFSFYGANVLWLTPIEIQHHKSDKLKSFCSPWRKTGRGWRQQFIID